MDLDFSKWDIVDLSFLGNSVERWAIALAIAVMSFFALYIVKSLLIRKIHNIFSGKSEKIGHAIEYVFRSTKYLFLFVIAFYFGSQALELPEKIEALIGKITILGLILQSVGWGNYLIKLWVGGYADDYMGLDAEKATTMKAVSGLSKMVLWTVLFLLALDNLGINVTTLIAGLGVGGIAVALAAQNILGDLFASLSIVFDKPFVIGDFVIVGTDMGTIERIGLKTTRVRSLSGEQLIFPNSDLLSSRVRNYKRMNERRIVFRFGVIYQTTYDQLKSIPDVVRDILEKTPNARLDRVHFASYGDSSLDFEVVYYVSNPDYGVYMDTQQGINLELFKRFEDAGIDFAYPTRTLYMIPEKAPDSQHVESPPPGTVEV